ncbi:TRAP transporter TatT component family protein [Alcanivorax sp. 24]|uniref:TRAP transporter TatT component family protein n=1 Tax=Alcanivorax sp. 24 TaxID=2545266 RepID=UPI00105E5580|nr:TRAP transporter TatT component family protein [Alcanivorax sp. 24]
MKQWRAVCAVVLLLVLQGCAVNRIGDNLARSIEDNNDLVLVGEGLPSYLLMVDGLILTWPERASLLRAGADLYGAYAGLTVEDPERAATLNEKALDYALRAACNHRSDYCDLRKTPVPEFEALLAESDDDDLPTLFTLGSAWAGYIQTHSGDWNAVAELARVRALMERVVALDEGYQNGQAHMYLGVLNSLLPASLGGQPEQAKAHFEQAVALSHGHNLLARVLYAENYARLMFDRELHDDQLHKVLEADPEQPGLTLQNTYAQQQARRLLDSADDYF